MVDVERLVRVAAARAERDGKRRSVRGRRRADGRWLWTIQPAPGRRLHGRWMKPTQHAR